MNNLAEIKYWTWDEQQQKPVGPYSTKEIDDLLKKGIVQNTSIVCVDGTTDWVPLHTVLKLKANTSKAVTNVIIDDKNQPIGKIQYVAAIRKESAYPTIRFITSLVKWIVFIIPSIVISWIGVIMLVSSMGDYGLIRESVMGIPLLLGGIIWFIIGNFLVESSLILIDLVDSFLDNHRRQIFK